MIDMFPFLLIPVAIVLWLWLAERDHRERRRRMGLTDEPSAYAQFIHARQQARIRAEARAGISPPVRRGHR